MQKETYMTNSSATLLRSALAPDRSGRLIFTADFEFPNRRSFQAQEYVLMSAPGFIATGNASMSESESLHGWRAALEAAMLQGLNSRSDFVKEIKSLMRADLDQILCAVARAAIKEGAPPTDQIIFKGAMIVWSSKPHDGETLFTFGIVENFLDYD